MSKDFDGTDFSAMALTLPAMVVAGTEAHIAVFPEGDALPKADFEDSKFTRWSLNVSLDGLVKETAAFKSLSVAVT